MSSSKESLFKGIRVSYETLEYLANEGDREAEFALGRWHYFAKNPETAARLAAYSFVGGGFDIRLVKR